MHWKVNRKYIFELYSLAQVDLEIVRCFQGAYLLLAKPLESQEAHVISPMILDITDAQIAKIDMKIDMRSEMSLTEYKKRYRITE